MQMLKQFRLILTQYHSFQKMEHILLNNGPVLKIILKKMNNKAVLDFASVSKAAFNAAKRLRPDVYKLATIVKNGCGAGNDEDFNNGKYEYCHNNRCARIATEAFLTGYEAESNSVLDAQAEWIKNGMDETKCFFVYSYLHIDEDQNHDFLKENNYIHHAYLGARSFFMLNLCAIHQFIIKNEFKKFKNAMGLCNR